MISANNITLRLGKKALFEEVNIKFTEGNCYGLIGANGAGKSTFLKFLLNKVSANSNGRCVLANGLRISYLPQDFTIHKGSLKNFALHQKLSYKDLLNILKKMGFPRTNFNVPIEEMSMGQQKRIALAKSLLEPADLYLWDEPANYLDVFNQDQLINLLQEIKPAMLLIDHDQYFIKQVADKRIKLAN